MNNYYEGKIYEGVDPAFLPSITGWMELYIKEDKNINCFPVIGSHSFKEGQEVVEGKDYIIDVDDANGAIYPTDKLEKVARPVASPTKPTEYGRDLLDACYNLLEAGKQLVGYLEAPSLPPAMPDWDSLNDFKMDSTEELNRIIDKENAAMQGISAEDIKNYAMGVIIHEFDIVQDIMDIEQMKKAKKAAEQIATYVNEYSPVPAPISGEGLYRWVKAFENGKLNLPNHYKDMPIRVEGTTLPRIGDKIIFNEKYGTVKYVIHNTTDTVTEIKIIYTADF